MWLDFIHFPRFEFRCLIHWPSSDLKDATFFEPTVFRLTLLCHLPPSRLLFTFGLSATLDYLCGSSSKPYDEPVTSSSHIPTLIPSHLTPWSKWQVKAVSHSCQLLIQECFITTQVWNHSSIQRQLCFVEWHLLTCDISLRSPRISRLSSMHHLTLLPLPTNLILSSSSTVATVAFRLNHPTSASWLKHLVLPIGLCSLSQ